jgi:hypothetical protein
MSYSIDFRDIDQRVELHCEFKAMERAVTAARKGKGCTTCGASNPGHASRMHNGTIRVLCNSCNDKQNKIRRDLAVHRARLEEVEKRRAKL